MDCVALYVLVPQSQHMDWTTRKCSSIVELFTDLELQFLSLSEDVSNTS